MRDRPSAALSGLRRLVSRATLALIFAACAAPNPSPRAGPSPSLAAPTPSHAAVSTPPPTLPPSPGPTPNPDCPTIEALLAVQPLYADLSLDPGIAQIDLQVTSIAPVWDPLNRVVPQATQLDQHPYPGIVLGGREFVTHPSYFGRLAGGASKLQSATASFAPDNQQPIALTTRFVPGNKNFDQVAVTVPDIGGDGNLELTLEWTDACFRFAATASASVTIVPKSETAGCSLGKEHWADDVRGLFDKGITVDSTEQDIFPTTLKARYLNEGTGGDPPNWAYQWKLHPGGIAATSGGWVEVSDGIKRRHTVVMDAELMRRSDALRLARDYYAAVSVLWTHQPTPRADGSFRIPVAAEPGRYVLIVRFRFSSTYLTGTATSAFSLDVE